jgi:toxin ParE1/3/4
MSHEVVLRPQAERDLEGIYTLIAADNPIAAIRFVRRLRELCMSLSDFPYRGVPRDDLSFGIRLLPFQRRAVVAYRVAGDLVEITNVFYGGRDFEAILRDSPTP